MDKHIGILSAILLLLTACAGMGRYHISGDNIFTIKNPSLFVSEYGGKFPVEIARGINILYMEHGNIVVIDKRKDAQLLFYHFNPSELVADRIILTPRKTMPENDYGLVLVTEIEMESFNNRYKEWLDDFINSFLAESDDRELESRNNDIQKLMYLNRIKNKIFPGSTGLGQYNNRAEYLNNPDERTNINKIISIKNEFKDTWDSLYTEESPGLLAFADKTTEEKMEEMYQRLEQSVDWDTRLGKDGLELRRSFIFFYKEIKSEILNNESYSASSAESCKRIEEVLDNVLYELYDEITKVIQKNYDESRTKFLEEINNNDLRLAIEKELIGIAERTDEGTDFSVLPPGYTIEPVRPIGIDNYNIGTVMMYPKNVPNDGKDPWGRLLDMVFIREIP